MVASALHRRASHVRGVLRGMETRVEPARFSKDALDTIKVLRSSGVSNRDARIVVERVTIDNLGADLETLVRKSFERFGKV